MKKNESVAKPEAENLWCKCPWCDHIVYKKDLEENFKTCPKCSRYLRMNSRERIEMFLDKKEDGSPDFKEMDADMVSRDPLQFGAPEDGERHKSPYLSKLQSEQRKTGLADAATCGQGKIGGHEVVMAVMDFDFMGGSMGSVVGEKFTRAIEKALDAKSPLILVCASGGARMQEGILSLMQMAKTSAALARLHEAGVLSVCVLCDPTTGGVTASYAMLGDILIAEPGALIAFAGPRVIEQTIREKLPEGFQLSEFLMKHGMIDCIVERKNLRSRLIQFLEFFQA